MTNKPHATTTDVKKKDLQDVGNEQCKKAESFNETNVVNKTNILLNIYWRK